MYLIFHDLQLRILTTYTSIWNLRQELFYCHGILLPINNRGITIAMYKISPTLLHPVVVLIMCCCCENKWWVVSSSQIDAQATTTIITPCYRPTPVGRLIRTSWCHKKSANQVSSIANEQVKSHLLENTQQSHDLKMVQQTALKISAVQNKKISTIASLSPIAILSTNLRSHTLHNLQYFALHRFFCKA